MSGDSTTVELRAFEPGQHIDLLRHWLGMPHVQRWWGEGPVALEESRTHPPDQHAIITANGVPVGYLRWQRPTPRELADAGLKDLPDALMDVDILIGEPSATGRGIGPRALGLLVERLGHDPDLAWLGLGSSLRNRRAIRAWEKAGFALFKVFQDSEIGPAVYLTRPLRTNG